MGEKYAEDPFNMGIIFLPEMSFIIGTFSDLQHTHPGISYWSRPLECQSTNIFLVVDVHVVL